MQTHSDCQDVPSRVHVALQDQSTADAGVNALGKCFGNTMSTRRAGLTGIGGVYSDYGSRGSFSLRGQDSAKHTPTSIGDGLGKAVVPDHACHVQVFNGKEAIAIDQLTGSLMHKVMPAVSYPFVDTRHNFVGFAPRRLLFLCQGVISSRTKRAKSVLSM